MVFNAIGNDSMTYNVGRGIQQGAANFYRHKDQENIGELDFFNASWGFNGLEDGTFYYGTNSVKAFIEEVRPSQATLNLAGLSPLRAATAGYACM